MARFASRGSLLALLLAGQGCRDEVDFEARRDELRDQIGGDAQVCPAVDEDFPCDADGPAGHNCIANALQACTPSELYSFDADSEEYWFVVASGDSCELVVLSLNPAILAQNRLRFGERTCGAIEAVPQANGACTAFRLLDCD